MPTPLPLTYVLPVATSPDEDVTELASYLRELASLVDHVLVVDGSSPEVVAVHRAVFGPAVDTVEPEIRTPMGKVGNVITGVAAARHEHVVIADDDVRYEPEQLHRIAEMLATADVVRPQNHFAPLPWHARVDTARTLLARVDGGDWPGTLGVRRSVFLEAGGYAGDVLFENLELVRTVRAAGGREHVALDLIVRRIPPTTAHFRGQQIRQAYDEFARPVRLVLSLLLAPATALAVGRRRWHRLVLAQVLASATAEVGRRWAGGRTHYPASSTVLAGPWLVWRSLCSWAAVGARLRGGARYRDVRLRRAATPMRRLRTAVATTGRDGGAGR